MSLRDLDDGLLEPERYELDEPPAYRFDLDRREFIAVLGAGILVSVSGSVGLAQERPGRRGRRGGSRDDTIGDRLHIGTDGVITVLTGKVEVGQGSRTQITMAAAEEFRVPVARIRLVMADSLLVPDDGGKRRRNTGRWRSACQRSGPPSNKSEAYWGWLPPYARTGVERALNSPTGSSWGAPPVSPRFALK